MSVVRSIPLFFLLASAASPAQASTPPSSGPTPSLEALAARVEQLERALAAREAASGTFIDTENEALKQRVAILERQIELQDEAATSAKASTPVFTVNDKGVAAKSADGAYEFKLRGTLA